LFEGFGGLLGSVPDNAFQRARMGESYDLKARVFAVLLGGLKLFGVGFISSIGTLSVSNGIWNIRKAVKGDMSQKPSTKRSPMFKTAFVYGSFLGLSANLRYQVSRQFYFFSHIIRRYRRITETNYLESCLPVSTTVSCVDLTF